MGQYVGLDVSLETTKVHVLDEQGKRVWRGTCKTPLKELTRSRKFQQPALANLWKSIGKSFLRKRMAGHMALMPRAVTR